MLSPMVVGLTALTSLATPLILPSQLIFAVPFAASIINLQWMYDEYHYLRSWSLSQGPDSPTTDRMLGAWYTAWRDSYGPLPSVVGLPMMWSASARFLYLNRASGINAITASYAIGLTLAIAHIPAGGKAFPLLTTVAEGNDGAMKALKTWLGMHVKRLCTVDVPAVAAFACGMYLVLS